MSRPCAVCSHLERDTKGIGRVCILCTPPAAEACAGREPTRRKAGTLSVFGKAGPRAEVCPLLTLHVHARRLVESLGWVHVRQFAHMVSGYCSSGLESLEWLENKQFTMKSS